MKTIMNLDSLIRIDQMTDFLTGSQAIAFVVAATKAERYQLIERILKRFAYKQLKRCDKGVVIRFLMKLSGYSRQQLTRMIEQFIKRGQIKRRQRNVHEITRTT
jgi:hypothetical protein